MRRFDETKLNDVYQYIRDCHINERRSPTFREIGAACGIGSTSWVSKLIGDGFNPWSGKIPHAEEQLSPCATSTEPVIWSS